VDSDLEMLEDEEEEYQPIEWAGMRWLRKMAEGDHGWQRIIGACFIFLGGALVFASAFLISNIIGDQPRITVFNKGFLIFGAIIMAAAILALIWRASYVGSVLAIAVCGYMLYEIGGLIVSYYVEYSAGIYLTFAGSLLGLMGGLISLSFRGAGFQVEIDLRDEQISALEGIVKTLTSVWEEAEKLIEARTEDSTPSMTDYENASSEAEKMLQEYHSEYEG
jgi:hypothetical protein